MADIADTVNLKKYVMMITLGYFGIKILEGAVHPGGRKLGGGGYVGSSSCPQGSSGESSTTQGYSGGSSTPQGGEISNYAGMVTMAGVLFLLNNMMHRNIMGPVYYFGFMLGLTAPFFRGSVLDTMDEKRRTSLNYLLYTVILVTVFLMIYLTMTATDDVVYTTNYLLYILVILLTVAGIIFTKSTPKVYSTTAKKTEQKGMFERHGETVNLGMTISAWLVSLLFVADADSATANNMIGFVQGVFLGVFVSGVSIYGMHYILTPTEDRRCVGDECRIKGMIINDLPSANLTSKMNTVRWIQAVTIATLIIMIVLFYTSTGFDLFGS